MKEEIEKAAEIVRNGGVILYPTDTVWGLGCDPANDKAVEKLIAIKNRPAEKSLIILVPDEALLQRYVKEIPEVCYDLIDYATSPLTIIYPQAQHLSPLIPAEDNSIGIRLTKDEFCVKLMKKLRSGIVSTSANLSNSPTPLSFHEISEEIKHNVDYVVPLTNHKGTTKPSQIIKIGANSEVQIIRK
ncbi:MAG: L-threonylcarbamoyladenylate synthase [Crocinitomicaceae bacterium]